MTRRRHFRVRQRPTPHLHWRQQEQCPNRHLRWTGQGLGQRARWSLRHPPQRRRQQRPLPPAPWPLLPKLCPVLLPLLHQQHQAVCRQAGLLHPGLRQAWILAQWLLAWWPLLPMPRHLLQHLRQALRAHEPKLPWQWPRPPPPLLHHHHLQPPRLLSF